MSINITNLTFIEYKTKRFYISHAPTRDNIENFITQLEKNNIKHVVRLCKPTYDSLQLESQGICLYDLDIPDGSAPDAEQIQEWEQILKNVQPSEAVLVHCVAGLGRAPMMVAIALINEQMKPYEAIEYIRKCRPGSINKKQLEFLVNYNL
jgi:protein tyrosine phosphatase type 4A